MRNGGAFAPPFRFDRTTIKYLSASAFCRLHKKLLNQISLFIEHTATNMVLQEMAVVPQSVEKSGIERFPQGSFSHVDIRIGRERAGFGAAVRVDMEEPASRCKTSAGAFLIPGERDKHNFRMLPAQAVDAFPDLLALGIAGGKVSGFIRNRHERDIDRREPPAGSPLCP